MLGSATWVWSQPTCKAVTGHKQTAMHGADIQGENEKHIHCAVSVYCDASFLALIDMLLY